MNRYDWIISVYTGSNGLLERLRATTEAEHADQLAAVRLRHPGKRLRITPPYWGDYKPPLCKEVNIPIPAELALADIPVAKIATPAELADWHSQPPPVRRVPACPADRLGSLRMRPAGEKRRIPLWLGC